MIAARQASNLLSAIALVVVICAFAAVMP